MLTDSQRRSIIDQLRDATTDDQRLDLLLQYGYAGTQTAFAHDATDTWIVTAFDAVEDADLLSMAVDYMIPTT